MTIFTNIPDTNLEPGDPIRSVDIIALKDNAKYLYEKLDNVDVQTFNSSGTWTKPSINGTQVGRMARIQVWGGGGGGSRSGSSTQMTGGGGGAYNETILPLSSITSTVSVTVGSGGTGRITSTGNGTTGGTSSFGSYCTAYGGGGGQSSDSYPVGGLGGEPLIATPSYIYQAGGSNSPDNLWLSTTGRKVLGYQTSYTGGQVRAVYEGYSGYMIYMIFYDGSSYQQTRHTIPAVGGEYIGGGGGVGEWIITPSTNSATSGGSSTWGGGGGGGRNGYGGKSIYGGNGGGSGAAGVAPGGGGGCGSATNTNGLNGASGRVIVTVW